MRRLLCALALAAALSLDAAALHGQPRAECAALLTAQKVGRPGPDPCQTLAVWIVDKSPSVQEAAKSILRDDDAAEVAFSPRDVQAQHPQQAALGGTPAQGHAIPGVQPAGVAAGTIAAVGTDAGNDALAALGLNPVILFLGDEASRRLAQYSRFADLTVFVPVSDLSSGPDAEEEGDGPRYFGARLRINFAGISSGSAVWDGAVALTRSWISQGGRNAGQVRQVLAQAPDLAGCVAALLAQEPSAAAITASCGSEVKLEVDLDEARQLREQLAVVRRAADARYFGVDVRFDKGDPTMGAVQDASGTFLFAGLSAGRRLGGTAGGSATYGIRSRLGVRHASLDGAEESEFAVEGGLGLEMARRIEGQEINASAAVEFRQGDAEDELTDALQTNFGVARGSLLIPITAGNSLSINVGTPIWGEVSPTLSVNFNWGLLLPGQSND